mmetsp:Transcript_9780/g.27672  ORF Transcript_9780/g.27672 Transcript_9780/m.27672 type:complete len:207 (+) Transcript_9780:329-949(+)
MVHAAVLGGHGVPPGLEFLEGRVLGGVLLLVLAHGLELPDHVRGLGPRRGPSLCGRCRARRGGRRRRRRGLPLLEDPQRAHAPVHGLLSLPLALGLGELFGSPRVGPTEVAVVHLELAREHALVAKGAAHLLLVKLAPVLVLEHVVRREQDVKLRQGRGAEVLVPVPAVVDQDPQCPRCRGPQDLVVPLPEGRRRTDHERRPRQPL